MIRDLTGGRGIDHVVETGSLESLPKSLLTCAWNAEIALVLALTGGSLDVTAMRGLINARRLFVGSRAAFEAMNRAISQHQLRPVIDRIFPFQETRAAYEYFDAKQYAGKVVIADRET